MSRHPRPRLVQSAGVVLAACAALVTAGQGSATAAASSVADLRYVALGDSYASGYGTTPVDDQVCGRGKLNYPAVLRSTSKPAAYTNVACSGATTRSIWNAEKGRPRSRRSSPTPRWSRSASAATTSASRRS
ncbi:hypothetical protein ACU635_27340 [[Actinomadura] parvosata]|uniref:hypothetical protein n=1 Tax=[Actinomadura] parvosata TaxID=1955412 RepID=UPI00406CA395